MEVQIRSSSNAISAPSDQSTQAVANGHKDNKDNNNTTPNTTQQQTETTPTIPANEALSIHPLQHRWTLWFDNPGKKTTQETWGSQLRKILTVDTVEDFWRLYNNITPASALSQASNYHFFKEGIEPKWEDEANKNGGKWVLALNTKSRKDNTLDTLWLWTLLACIGESFEDEDEICGCVISIRKQQDKISLWTRNGADNEEATKRVGRKLKEVLGLVDGHQLGYQLHSEAQARDSSYNNANRFKI